MDSDLYLIEVKDDDATFGNIMMEHEEGLSTAIVDKICYAIENGLRRVDIAMIVTKMHKITLHASQYNFYETLETNMDNLIKYENYELCARAKKHLDNKKVFKKNIDI